MTDSANHFDTALKAGRLEFQRCRTCSHAWLPERASCPNCLSTETGWDQATGRARVVSWIIYHRAYADHLKGKVPYNVAIVALDEGPQMITNILGGPPEGDVYVGLPVEAVIDCDGAMPLCRFRSAKEL
jgi:hypothetical protein